MCEPTTIALIGVAISAAATTVAVSEERKNVSAQNKFNEESAKEGAALADESFKNQANQVNLRMSQEEEASNRAILENAKRASQARATARASAGEAGVAGVSVNALINDFYRQEGGYNESVNRNLQLDQQQSQLDLLGLRSGTVSRINDMKRPVIRQPSYLPGVIDAAVGGLGVYSKYKLNQTAESQYTG